jgi:hypothetical protein
VIAGATCDRDRSGFADIYPWNEDARSTAFSVAFPVAFSIAFPVAFSVAHALVARPHVIACPTRDRGQSGFADIYP